MSDKHLVLVTGATGAVGPTVVRVFRAAGYRLRTLSVDHAPVGTWPDDVETVIGDVTDLSTVQYAMKDVQYVLHLAALLHLVNPPAGLKGEYERVNVGGTSIIVDAAIRAGVKMLVFFSTVAVYGNCSGQTVNELSSTRPDTFYARTKLKAEEIVLNARRTDGKPIGTVMRLGAVYGANVKGNYARLAKALARGRFIPIGNGTNRRVLIYDEDVARAALLVTQHPWTGGRLFNVTDGEFHTLREIIQAICRGLGRKPPRFSIPEGFARTIACGLEKTGRLIGLESLTLKSMIDKYTEDIAVDATLFQRELGFVPRYNLATGWQETISQMRSMGGL